MGWAFPSGIGITVSATGTVTSGWRTRYAWGEVLFDISTYTNILTEF